MATLNLGRIKPVFKGAYSGSTAYVIDDIVTSGGSSYICIQAHGAGTQAVTVTAYWSVMASTGTAGTDGTDLTSTITTQGDILYRDGSGLQRLAKPASNKTLQNTSGGVLSWETASGGKTLGLTQFTQATRVVLSSTASDTLMSGSYTQIKASTKLLISYLLKGDGDASGASNMTFVYDGVTVDDLVGFDYSSTGDPQTWSGSFLIDGASSTGAKAWTIGWATENGNKWFSFWSILSKCYRRCKTRTNQKVLL